MAFCHASELVNLDFDDTSYRGSPELPSLVAGEWRALERYLTGRLSQGKPGGAANFGSYIADLDRDLDSFKAQLSDGSTVVAVNQGYIGHVMIFTPGANGPVLLWHIDAVARLAPGSDDALDCWTTDADRPCFVHAIGLIPPDAGGAPRFFIDAGLRPRAAPAAGNSASGAGTGALRHRCC